MPTFAKQIISKIIHKRDEKLISAYKKGEKIRMLEALFGLTKTRIYQILNKHGVDICRNEKKRVLDKKK
jgi:Mor family transcriptional regulator